MSNGRTVALSGLAALAIAMGIGRFAFTPILPMMQEDRALSLVQGSWLASANYAGYLFGALWAMRSRMASSTAIIGGLVTIALTTALAAHLESTAALMVLRFLPGMASALVLVYVSAWSLEALDASGQARLGGIVFGGVGVGIAFSGLVCLALTRWNANSDIAWTALGASAFVATAGIWPVLRAPSRSRGKTEAVSSMIGELIPHWRLVFAHGAFGFGYIIPATFLPVMAKQVVADPAAFGWAWPIFGAAATLSPVLTARFAARFAPTRLWAAGLTIMAIGVVAPIAEPGLAGIIVAAFAVGGTFMVVTMIGMQEAKRVAGESGKTLIAAMTAAFAIGQIIGPLLVGAFVHVKGGFAFALITAATPLFIAAYLIRRNSRGIDAESASPNMENT